ncbi:MAG: FAD-binding oxidoreductase, partial [Bacteroidota bacterium]|nr:FAD-binding oxidoreductase [Bacteroidota bacterium]
EIIQQELERFLREVILPANKQPYTIDYRWSGIMGMGKDKLPDVTEIKPNVFCAINLGGMGLALAPLIGKKVSRMMCG